MFSTLSPIQNRILIIHIIQFSIIFPLSILFVLFSNIKFPLFFAFSFFYFSFIHKQNEKKHEHFAPDRKLEYYIGAILDAIFGVSFGLVFFGDKNMFQFYLILITLCIYHYAEYLSVLFYHLEKCSWNCFLINHSKAWCIAQSLSFCEFFIEFLFFKRLKNSPFLTLLGLLFTVVGQFFRISALFTGKKNFTHLLSYEKKKEHVLVTWGIYSICRHPSYFGFYLWCLGNELLLLNPICFLGFTVVLFRFFKNRILIEEGLLIEFFGEEYIKYSQKVPILIPFIKLSKEDVEDSLRIHYENMNLKEDKGNDRET